MGLKKKLKKLLEKLVGKVKAWIDEQNAAADAAREEEEQESCPSSVELPASSVPWNKCRYSSNWNGTNASRRHMNMVSPKMSDKQFGEYLSWIIANGCDHVHLLMVNQADGECAGYDALTDSKSRQVALDRVVTIRAKGLGVVAWVVADDSDGYRKQIFANPKKYADGLSYFFPYLSYICLGLEMDEGEGSIAKWQSLRDAIKAAGWNGKFATHHTSGKATHAGLGSIVMDQLDPSCSTADIAKSVKALKAKGYEVCGFEYSRGPDKSRSQAALDAGAFSCGNWKGSSSSSSTPSSSSSAEVEDAVSFGDLQWSYGGFKGGSAKLAANPRIYNLSVSSGGMSYKWMQGGCEDLGAMSREDYDHTVACLFVLVSGQWKGGKFDWISTSRTSRDFANIKDSYNGWPSNSIAAAEKYAFCIVSKDGKSRTNVISCGR